MWTGAVVFVSMETKWSSSIYSCNAPPVSFPANIKWRSSITSDKDVIKLFYLLHSLIFMSLTHSDFRKKPEVMIMDLKLPFICSNFVCITGMNFVRIHGCYSLDTVSTKWLIISNDDLMNGGCWYLKVCIINGLCKIPRSICRINLRWRNIVKCQLEWGL